MSIKKSLVLGAGYFGKKSVSALRKRRKPVIVVDRDPLALALWDRDDDVSAICADGIEYLRQSVDLSAFEWIIPAIPLHVAFSWLQAWLNDKGIDCRKIPVPQGLNVPHSFYAENGTLYASFAGHLCPEDCPEPPGYCSLTGEERQLPLYRVLENLSVHGFSVYVIQSHQLAPGVGGFSSCQLEHLAEKVAAHRTPGLCISSCGCHAVIDAFAMA